MPNTLTGWILFAAMTVSGCAGAALSTKVILSGSGKAPYHRGDNALILVFTGAMIFACGLFLYVEMHP